MFTLSTLLVFTLAADGASASTAEPAPRSYRMIDVNGDGRLDRLQVDVEGSLSISINRGARQFEPIVQQLPQVAVNDVLAEDLDGDGYTDLYLVSQGANAALLGDGSGMFVSDDGTLGLADAAVGLSAERVDVDGDGLADILLRNVGGDVVFWGTGAQTFERDPAAPESAPEVLPAVVATPVVAGSAPVGSVDEASTAPREASFAREGRSGGARVPVKSPSASPGAPRGGTIESGGGNGLDPSIEEVVQIPFGACASSVMDATSGTCMSADSVPAFGALYPLGMEFNILPTGEIGMGTTAPEAEMHLANGAFPQLRITPGTVGINQGGAEVYFGEGRNFDCGFRLNYDGTAPENPFKIISQCTTPSTRLAIHRSQGTVLIGGDDFDASVAGPGLLRVNGEVSQPIASNGMVKASVHVDGTLTTPTVSRFFNNLPGASGVTVTRLGTGSYQVDFGADVSNRFYVGTIGTAVPSNAPNATIEVTPRSVSNNAVYVELQNGAGNFIDSEFFVTVL